MKKLVLFSTILAFSLCALAQQVSYKYSQVEEYKSANNKMAEVLSFSDKGAFFLEEDGALTNRRYFVKKYGPNLKLLYRTELELEKKTARDNRGFLGVKICNNQAYGLFYHWVDASSTYNLVIRKLDENGQLGEEVVIGNDKPERFGKAPYYKLIASENGEYLSAVGILPFVKGQQEEWHIISIKSADLSVVLDKIINTEIPRERFEKNDLLLSNSGSVLSYKKWKVKKLGHFSAVVAVESTGKVNTTEISLEGKAVSDHKFIITKDGKIGLLGLYEPDKKFYKRIAGHFYYVFDQLGRKTSSFKEDLGSMVLEKVFVGLEKGKASKPNQPIKEFRLVNVLEMASGDISILLEKYDETSTAAPGAPPEAFLKLYTRKHKNLLEIQLDKTGKKKRTLIFKKEQEYKTLASNKYWGGVVPFMKENELYFVWNNTNFPTVPAAGSLFPQPGWIDATGTKHFASKEYGDRMRFPTCLSGISQDGSFLFPDQPVPYAIPLVEMYKQAIYKYVFSSNMYAQNGNELLLLMEMEQGFSKGETKYQICTLKL